MIKELKNTSLKKLEFSKTALNHIIVFAHLFGLIFCFCNNACHDGYCSTVQGLLDWFEVDLGFPELFLFRLICVLSVFVSMLSLFVDQFAEHTNR